MPTFEERQARYEELVVSRPPQPYPIEPERWLAGLDRSSLAFIANRLFGLPSGSHWESRAHCEASVLVWLGGEDADSPRDRIRHDTLVRWMLAEQAHGQEVWPEPVLDARVAFEVVDAAPDAEGEWGSPL